MDRFMRDCLMRISPFIQEDEILEAKMINEFDVLFIFKDGRRIIFDSDTNYHREQYDEDYELTEEQLRREFRMRLRTMMRRKGISQEELANRLGTSQVVISRYVTGTTLPDCIRIKRIAEILDCSVDDFYYKYY